ncbi:MAG: PqqD family protein [Bacteroidetes bacterium]|nr:PqqD family protein [Bacteroidota bacterium]
MSYNSTQQFALTEKTVSTILDENSIILNYDQGIYYELNEVGSLIWKTLSESTEAVSLEQLKTNVLSSFEVTEDECIQDINSLLVELIEAELVTTI